MIKNYVNRIPPLISEVRPPEQMVIYVRNGNLNESRSSPLATRAIQLVHGRRKGGAIGDKITERLLTVTHQPRRAETTVSFN